MGIAWGIPVTALVAAAGFYLAFRLGRRAPAAPREPEEISRFFSLALELFCITDGKGRFLRLNQAWETTLGHADLEGKVFLDYVHPKDLEGTLAAFGQLSQGREVVAFMNRFRCKDGSRRWIEWRAYPVGDLIYLVGRDLTNARQAEESLRASESKFQALADQLGEGLVIADRESVYQYCSKRFAELLGYSPQELLGKGPLDTVMEYERATTRIRLEERARGKSDQYEVQLKHKDGSPLDCQISAIPFLDDQGNFTGSLVLATDITARKRAEESARRILMSESLNLMASGIAHDFNNRLQALQSSLEAVLAHPRKTKAGLERALGIAGEAAALSRKFLDYSGRGGRRAVPVDLPGLLLSRMEQLKLFTRPGVPLHVQAAKDLPPVKGDPDQLQLVLSGLIANAGEAMEAGTIQLSVDLVHLSEAELRPQDWIEPPPSAEVVCLSVSDTGEGIAPEHLGHIFEPFFSTKAEGRGLGLSAALAIIRNHHAGLQVLSTASGSTFRICFEPLGPENADLPPGAPVTPVSRVQTILLVDDDSIVRDVTAESLREILGYEVLVARDGAEAVEVFREHADSISLILMDAVMPKLPGTKAFEVIQQIHPGVRAILCSGYGDEVGLEAVARHGFQAFLKKPFTIQELSDAIEKAAPRP